MYGLINFKIVWKGKNLDRNVRSHAAHSPLSFVKSGHKDANDGIITSVCGDLRTNVHLQ